MAALARKNSPEADESFLPTTLRMASLAADKKARELLAYDVRGLTLVADAFLMCTVTSEPQMRAVFNAVKAGMKEAGIAPLHSEGTHQGGWLLMDYGAVILHIFRPKAREFYDLDGLWADAPTIPLDLDDN